VAGRIWKMSWTSSRPDLYGRAQAALKRSGDVISMVDNEEFDEHAFYIKSVGAGVVVLKTGVDEERIDVYATDEDMEKRAKEFVGKLLEEKLNDE